MPRRKRHYVYCKAGLHRLPPPHVSPGVKNAAGIKRQPRRVGDRGRIYVARQCVFCKSMKKSMVSHRRDRLSKSLKRKPKRVLTQRIDPA